MTCLVIDWWPVWSVGTNPSTTLQEQAIKCIYVCMYVRWIDGWITFLCLTLTFEELCLTFLCMTSEIQIKFWVLCQEILYTTNVTLKFSCWLTSWEFYNRFWGTTSKLTRPTCSAYLLSSNKPMSCEMNIRTKLRPHNGIDFKWHITTLTAVLK